MRSERCAKQCKGRTAMRLKDIEKKLRREQESKTVPEVYARASRAPLNKLLSGETPARAFQKQLVMRLLVIVLALFLVAAIGLSAMWLAPSNGGSTPDCYACITVSGEGGELRIGLILRSGRNIVTAVEEVSSGKLNTKPIVSHSSQIKDFIKPNKGDKVRVSLISNASAALTEGMRFIVNELEYIYSGAEFDMITDANNAQTKTGVVEYITACGGRIEVGASADEIIKTYAALFA